MRLAYRFVLAIFLVFSAGRAASAQTVRVTVDGASVWSAPSIPSIVLLTVKAGTTLEVLARTGTWYRVRLPNNPGGVGYILVSQTVVVPGGAAIPGVPPSSPRAAQRAPQRRGPPRRAFLSAGAAYQPGALASEQKGTFTDFVEQGSRTVTYKTEPVALFDVSYGVEVLRGLFIAGAVSRVNGSRTADIEEQVPHPFLFGEMRTLEGTATDLPREEIAVHFQAAMVASVGRHLQVSVAAGPSFFKLKQTFVTDVAYTQEYPYDTVTYASATTAPSEKNRWGFNVQANVTAMLDRHLGVDGFVRFSQATLRFTGSDESTFTVPAGGVHVGIGFESSVSAPSSSSQLPALSSQLPRKVPGTFSRKICESAGSWELGAESWELLRR